MKRAILVLTTAAVALLVGWDVTPVAAQHAGHGGPPAPTGRASTARTGKDKGKVVELDRSSITVEIQRKRSTERVTYLLGDRAEIKGDLQPGTDVVVHYREEFGSKTATRIEVKKSKQKEAREKT